MVYTFNVKDSVWVASIGGFRYVGALHVDEVLSQVEEAVKPSIFQLFDADKVGGWKHLFFAAVNAVKAFETGVGVSKSLAIEVLLYASCQDQISQAFDIIGISPSSRRLALIVLAQHRGDAVNSFKMASKILGTEDDSVLVINEEKYERLKRTFGITETELAAVGSPREEALSAILVERGALLPLRK